MRRLVYLPQANRELAHILRYITRTSGSLETGLNFIAQLRQKCEDFARLQVVMGRPRDDLEPGLRGFPYKDYIILFRYFGDIVEIVTVVSAKRDIDSLFDEE